jgi:hypothetical protein
MLVCAEINDDCVLAYVNLSLMIDFELIASSYLPQLFKKMGALKGSIKKVEQGINANIVYTRGEALI